MFKTQQARENKTWPQFEQLVHYIFN